MCVRILSTVKPLYKGYPWSEDKVACTEGWPLQRGSTVVSYLINSHLLSIVLILNRVHSTALFGSQAEVKLGVLAETTRIAQERILLIVVDSSADRLCE